MRTALLAFDVSHPLALICAGSSKIKWTPRGRCRRSSTTPTTCSSPPGPTCCWWSCRRTPNGAAALNRVRSQVAGRVLAVGPTADPKLILRTLQEGADHYLDEDDLAEQFAAVLPRLKSVPKQGFGKRGGAAAAGRRSACWRRAAAAAPARWR